MKDFHPVHRSNASESSGDFSHLRIKAVLQTIIENPYPTLMSD
ncbi:MAG: hypothetical protein QM666_05815 [Acinetobacter sp.]